MLSGTRRGLHVSRLQQRGPRLALNSRVARRERLNELRARDNARHYTYDTVCQYRKLLSVYDADDSARTLIAGAGSESASSPFSGD